MLHKLRVKVIYEDFISKVNLTDEQIKILNMLLNKDTYVKISMELGMSERTLGYEVRKIKNLYDNYVALEKSKLEVLLNK